jgi:hypothetical protein
LFQVICYQAQLTLADLEIMSIGNCLDYVQEWVEAHNPKKKKVRRAKQADFDNF